MKLLGRKLDLCEKCQAGELGPLPEDFASWPKFVSTEAVVAHLTKRDDKAARAQEPGQVSSMAREKRYRRR